MFTNIEQWLGCLDLTTSQGLWQCCLYITENAPTFYVDYFLVFDTLNPDALPGVMPFVEAFAAVFGLTYAVIEIDEVPTPVYLMNNPVQWYASAALVLTYPPDFAGAPCTQITFP